MPPRLIWSDRPLKVDTFRVGVSIGQREEVGTSDRHTGAAGPKPEGDRQDHAGDHHEEDRDQEDRQKGQHEKRRNKGAHARREGPRSDQTAKAEGRDRSHGVGVDVGSPG